VRSHHLLSARAPLLKAVSHTYIQRVTTDNSGIGANTALAFARAGCTQLIITDISEASLSAVEAQLSQILSSQSQTPDILSIAGDISSPEFISSLFSSIKSHFGRLDYAVNCAGIIGNNLPSDECTVEDFDKVNNVNYRGLWMCSRAELEIMKGQEVREREGYGGVRKQRGAIVNIASQLGVVGRPSARESDFSASVRHCMRPRFSSASYIPGSWLCFVSSHPFRCYSNVG
jgi:NAD(P)-dependent dehydrogenase (short-subunit alcohol dehydrogenase family)